MIDSSAEAEFDFSQFHDTKKRAAQNGGSFE